MRIFNIVIMRKQRLEEIKSEECQKVLELGFKQGQIYQAAEDRKKGCILSLEVQGQVERILNESEDGRS